ncbi:MAG: hypothetical protein FWG98_02915 [Candidatus Cloacimonetes bacterium]|nr:hypothetical protein [Candidatus Cloacimonadota bacterium]
MNHAIHITHEAAKKIGGIGSVLSGMCTSETYLKHFDRTLFYGPLFDDRPNPEYEYTLAVERLGGNAKVHFSTIDNISGSKYDILFYEMKKKYGIEIVYGEKTLYDEIYPDKSNVIEILLIGISGIKPEPLNVLKFKFWETFNFACQNFENDWDFEQYLRIAVPFNEICDGLFEKKGQNIFFSHEYMGIASCLAIILENSNHLLNKTNTSTQKKEDIKNKNKIYFHAHELTTARTITEKIPGHDVTFYRFIDLDLKAGISMEERFGSQQHNPRNELVKLTKHFDGVFAVGDWVKKEYNYLIPEAEKKKIHICYNGTPDPNHSFDDKLKARKKIKQYCENLFNFSPDVIMSHVTRLVVSKGLWRDLSLLEELDKKFTKDKIKGFCVILSNLIGNGRTDNEVAQMEESYGWPVMHKSGYPDLLGYEEDIYWSCQYFNAKSRSIKVIFINQFGFTPERVGKRLPEGTTFADLRLASDAEFGMSIYEPFGIAQIETIPFGGIAIMTKVCGSAFLLEKTFKEEKVKPFYIFDFALEGRNKETQESKQSGVDVEWLNISSQDREIIEKDIIKKNIDKVYKILPKTDTQRKDVFLTCKKHVDKLSWNEVIKAMPFFNYQNVNNQD